MHREALERHVTITASNGLRITNFREIVNWRDLLWHLSKKEIAVRYKQSLLGLAWAVLQPLVMMIIFTAIFSYVARIQTEAIPYPVFSIVGLLIWLLFTRILTAVSDVLINNSHLITKIYFPRLLLPLSTVTAAMVDFLVSVPLLCLLLILFEIQLGWTICLTPLFLLLAVLIALGMGLCLSAINVHYRDVKHTVPFMVQIWMFCTPVAYPLTVIPEKWKLVYSLNPMVGVTEGFRWSVLGSGEIYFPAILISVTFASVIFILGLLCFETAERSFADII